MYFELSRALTPAIGVGFCSRLLIANSFLRLQPQTAIRLTIDGVNTVSDFFQTKYFAAEGPVRHDELPTATAIRNEPAAIARFAHAFRYSAALTQHCQEVFQGLGAPQVALQIRETDKHDDPDDPHADPEFFTPIPSHYYVDWVGKALVQHERIFVASDSAVTLDLLKSRYPNRVCSLDMQRSRSMLPMHILKHLGKRDEQQQIDEYAQVRELLVEIYVLRECQQVFFGLMSGVVLAAAAMNGFTRLDLNDNPKYRPMLQRKNLSELENALIEFYSQRERTLWRNIYDLYAKTYGSTD